MRDGFRPEVKRNFVLVALLFAVIVATAILVAEFSVRQRPLKPLAGEAFRFVVDNTEFQDSFSIQVSKGSPKLFTLELDGRAERASFDLSGTGTDVKFGIGDAIFFGTAGVLSENGFTVSDFSDGEGSEVIKTPEAVYITLPAGSVIKSAFVDLAEQSETTGLAPVTGSQIAEVSASLSDLDVTYIERTPLYEYDGHKKWPAVGDAVTFTAHIKNSGDAKTGEFSFKWYLDGAEVKSGVHSGLASGWEGREDLAWSWQEGVHFVKFVADSQGLIAEESEFNNAVEDRTDALAVGFWVEQSVYDWFSSNQLLLGVGSNSWEDWAQRQIREWNRIFAASSYPSSPEGVKDRVRLGKVVVVGDGSIVSGNHPVEDKTVDLMWGFSSRLLKEGFYNVGNKPKLSLEPPDMFYIEYPLMHELSHARYLGDAYAWNFNPHPPMDDIKVLQKDGSKLIAKGVKKFYECTGGLMSCSSPLGRENLYSEEDVLALNRIAGQRPKCGNYNSPCNLGDYYLEIPKSNYVKVLDVEGKAVANANVFVYQSVRDPQESIDFYDKLMDDKPDISCLTGSDGLCSLGANPFVSSSAPFEPSLNGVALLRVEKGDEEKFRWFYLSEANMAYWKGNREKAVYEIRTSFKAPQAPVVKCPDGTLYGKCSEKKPEFCESGVIVNSCESCGCNENYVCQEDGSCKKKEAPPVKKPKSVRINGREIQLGRLDISQFLVTDCNSVLCNTELLFTSDAEAALQLSGLKIDYGLKVGDFSSLLNSQCSKYPCFVPVTVSSSSDGTLSLGNLQIVTKLICNSNSVCEFNEDETSCPADCMATKGGVGGIDTNLKSLGIKINGMEAGKRPESKAKVRFEDDSKPLFEFDYEFSKKQLDLGSLKVEKRKAGSGLVWVKGLDLDSGAKTVYLETVKNGMKFACIKDAEVDSLESITPYCTGQDEVLLECDGVMRQGYACEPVSGYLKVSGLSHSVVYEPSADVQMPRLPVVNISNSTDGSLSLNWSSVAASVAGNPLQDFVYHVFRVYAAPGNANVSGLNTSIAPFSAEYLTNLSGTSFIDKNVSNNSIYTYAVTASAGAIYNATVLNMLLSNNTATANATPCHSESCQTSIQPPAVSGSSSPAAGVGGGGGGGGGGSALPSESFMLQKVLNAGDTGMFAYRKFADISVSQIAVEVGRAAANPAVTVKETALASTVPPSITIDAGKAYKYLSITKSGMENISKAAIRFSVPNTWFSNNSLDMSTTSLNRLVSNNWVKLQTFKMGADKAFTGYEAETPGFSIFAITAEKIKRAATAKANASEPETKAQGGLQKAIGQQPLPQQPLQQPLASSLLQPRKAVGKSNSPIVFGLIATLLIIVFGSAGVVSVHLLRRKRNITGEELSELKLYVYRNLRNGVSPAALKAALISSGWPPDVVNKTLQKLVKTWQQGAKP